MLQSSSVVPEMGNRMGQSGAHFNVGTKKKSSFLDFFKKKETSVSLEGAFYLGDLSSGKPYYCTENQLGNHIEVVAAPGIVADFLKNLISDRILHGHGLIVLNLKSEMGDWAVDIAKAAGRESEMRLVSLGHPEHSVSYNPIQQGTAPEIHKLLMNSLDRSINWSMNGSMNGAINRNDEQIKNVSSTVLLTLLRSLCDYRDKTGDGFYLGKLYELLNVPGALHEFYKKLIAAQCQVSVAMQFLIQKLDLPAEREKLQPLVTLLRLLAPWVEGQSASFDFSEAIDESRILFFQLNERELQTTSQVYGKMVLQDLMRLVQERYAEMNEGRASVKQVMLILDDYASLAVPQFSEFMSFAKSANLSIVFVNPTRVEAQIESRAGTVLVVGPQTEENAEYFSCLMGTSVKPVISPKKLMSFNSEEGFVETREMGEKISADFIRLHARPG